MLKEKISLFFNLASAYLFAYSLIDLVYNRLQNSKQSIALILISITLLNISIQIMYALEKQIKIVNLKKKNGKNNN